jgi:hypothetical protein
MALSIAAAAGTAALALTACRNAYAICSSEYLKRFIVPVSLDPAGCAVEDSERHSS